MGEVILSILNYFIPIGFLIKFNYIKDLLTEMNQKAKQERQMRLLIELL